MKVGFLRIVVAMELLVVTGLLSALMVTPVSVAYADDGCTNMPHTSERGQCVFPGEPSQCFISIDTFCSWTQIKGNCYTFECTGLL